MEECTENIDETKLSKIALFEHKNECVCYYTVFIVLAVIALTVSIGIGAYFTYKCITSNKENISIFDYVYQAKKYLSYKMGTVKQILKIELIIFTTTWSISKILSQTC